MTEGGSAFVKDAASLTVCPPSTFWARPRTPLRWLSWRQSVRLDTTWTGRTCTWLPLWLRSHKRRSQNEQTETGDGRVKCDPITSAHGRSRFKTKGNKARCKAAALNYQDTHCRIHCGTVCLSFQWKLGYRSMEKKEKSALNTPAYDLKRSENMRSTLTGAVLCQRSGWKNKENTLMLKWVFCSHFQSALNSIIFHWTRQAMFLHGTHTKKRATNGFD